MFTNRDGSISILKVSLVVGLVAALLVGGGIYSFVADQNSRRTPLEITLYPGAVQWGMTTLSDVERTLFYRIDNATPEQVADFYQLRMNEHYGDAAEECVRTPPEGSLPASLENPNAIPYQFACLFDRSGINTTQFTRILIYPGAPNEIAEYDTEGATVIEYQQRWQR